MVTAQFIKRCCLTGVLALVTSLSARAQANATSAALHTTVASEKTPYHLALLQQAGGLRQQLAAHGISGAVSMTDDWSADLRGGARPLTGFNRLLLDGSLAVDTRKLVGWEGASAFARLHFYQGQNGGDYVGDAQGFSNIDDVPRTMLYELWFEQKIPNRNWRVRAGKVDANTLFATVENGGDFLNSSMGYSPTILKLPTYPIPRPSVNLLFDNGRRSFAGGLYATDDSGLMWLAEGGQRFSFGDDAQMRTGLGFWQLRGRLDAYDGSTRNRTAGMYLVQELTLRFKSEKRNRGEQSLGLFLQYGYADDHFSPFSNHVGSGLVWRSPFGRGGQVLGVGMSVVTFSQCPGSDFDYGSESAFEFFYKVHLSRFLSLVPDLQVIHHPDGLKGTGDAVVFTPRLNLAF
jgi:carbohydrate-selective porin OprB